MSKQLKLQSLVFTSYLLKLCKKKTFLLYVLKFFTLHMPACSSQVHIFGHWHNFDILASYQNILQLYNEYNTRSALKSCFVDMCGQFFIISILVKQVKDLELILSVAFAVNPNHRVKEILHASETGHHWVTKQNKSIREEAETSEQPNKSLVHSENKQNALESSTT